MKNWRLIPTHRNAYFKITIGSFAPEAGKPITPETFFGPYFNFSARRPVLLGQTPVPTGHGYSTLGYYYYDDPEIPSRQFARPSNSGCKFVTHGYADACLHPPHTFGGSEKTNLEIGRFFLGMNDFIFSDIEKITVYAWPVECSNYFGAGLEWWGSFFFHDRLIGQRLCYNNTTSNPIVCRPIVYFPDLKLRRAIHRRKAFTVYFRT